MEEEGEGREEGLGEEREGREEGLGEERVREGREERREGGSGRGGRRGERREEGKDKPQPTHKTIDTTKQTIILINTVRCSSRECHLV